MSLPDCSAVPCFCLPLRNIHLDLNSQLLKCIVVYYLPSIKAAKLYIISWHRDKKSIPWMLCQCQTCSDYIRDFYVLEQGEHTSHWT